AQEGGQAERDVRGHLAGRRPHLERRVEARRAPLEPLGVRPRTADQRLASAELLGQGVAASSHVVVSDLPKGKEVGSTAVATVGRPLAQVPPPRSSVGPAYAARRWYSRARIERSAP